MLLKKRSALALAAAGLITQPALAAEGSIFESAYDRAEKAFHSKEWKELPDEQLIRASRIKWNRLAKAALNLPDWVEFSLSQRTRYENVSNNWRAGQTNRTNSQLPLQSRLRLGINQGPFWVLFEGQDSRTHYDEPGDLRGNAIEDKFDILQLFGSVTLKNVFDTGLRTDFHVGRFTLEMGKARLIGRNNFPNNTNSFDGGHLAVGNGKDWRVRTFLTAPVVRDDVQLDESTKQFLFWGTAFESTQLKWFSGEAYYLGISDSRDPRPNRSRNFSTFGAHAYKDPVKKRGDLKAGEFENWDYDLESAVQTGKRNGKDHFAYMGNVTLGYTFNAPWMPRIDGEYFYASGSDNPNGDSNTFDRLFGLRAFEMMRTSLFGPFNRQNIESPGWRITVKPKDNIRVYLKHHAWWLAESKDAFQSSALSGFSNLQDKTGGSGSYLGQDIEFVGQYKFGSNLIVDAGYQHWFKGDFFDKLAKLPNRGGLPKGGEEDTDYFFVQTEFRF